MLPEYVVSVGVTKAFSNYDQIDGGATIRVASTIVPPESRMPFCSAVIHRPCEQGSAELMGLQQVTAVG